VELLVSYTEYTQNLCAAPGLLYGIYAEPLCSSWSISLLISFAFAKEYNQESSVGLKSVPSLIPYTFHKEYTQEPSAELLVH
jgi:hypothetical protein